MLSIKPILVTNEIMYVGEAIHPDQSIVHLFGYTASVKTTSEGLNVLAFPLPSDRVVCSDQVVDTKTHRPLLNLLSVYVDSNVVGVPLQYDCSLVSSSNEIGQGTVVIEGLSEFAALIGEFFPNHQLLVCSFDSFPAQRQFTIWVWYKPTRVEVLFLPTTVGTENLIDPKSEIQCDYWALMSTLTMTQGPEPSFSFDVPWNLMAYMPSHIVGRKFDGWHQNADTVSSVEGIRVALPDSIHRRPIWGLWHG